MPICNRCGKDLATNQTLQYHLNKKKRCDLRFSCSLCKESFSSEHTLRSHYKGCSASHVSSLKFVCTLTHEDLVVLNRNLIIVESGVSDEIGQLYSNTLFPRFKHVSDVFLAASTSFNELVQKKTGSWRFIRTKVFHDFIFVIEHDAAKDPSLTGRCLYASA